MEDQQSKSYGSNLEENFCQENSDEERGSPGPKLGEDDEILISVYIGDIPFIPHSETEDEGCLDISIHKDATLEELKLEIQKRYRGLKPYFQVLIFKNDVMGDDERKLSEYGVEDDTELELETARICEECGDRVYRIGDNAWKQCMNCNQTYEDNREADEGA